MREILFTKFTHICKQEKYFKYLGKYSIVPETRGPTITVQKCRAKLSAPCANFTRLHHKPFKTTTIPKRRSIAVCCEDCIGEKQ